MKAWSKKKRANDLGLMQYEGNHRKNTSMPVKMGFELAGQHIAIADRRLGSRHTSG